MMCDIASRKLALKKDDVCIGCDGGLRAGETAYWDSGSRTVTCLACHEAPAVPGASVEIDRGDPGASLQREYERRRDNREREIRRRHPHIGGFLVAVRPAPQHEVAFRSGAQGERDVAKSLERRTKDSPALILHNRLMPKGRGDIDHIAIARSGVFVIDAKNHKAGKVTVTAPIIGEPRLLIAGGDRTDLIDGLDRQVAAVRTAMAAAGIEAPVTGVLCFTQAELPLLMPLKLRSHLILYRKALAKRINAHGPLGAPQISELAATLAARLPRA